MRSVSHTLIATIRTTLEAWRRQEGWSRESVVDVIVKQYRALRGDLVTGLVFDEPGRDAVQYLKNNADRIYRWLDDQSKDTNLLPSNMVPFILAALPVGLRIDVANELLMHSGMTVRLMADDQAGCVTQSVQAIAKEGGEAIAALAGINEHSTDDQIKDAMRELTESAAEIQKGMRLLEGRLAGQE